VRDWAGLALGALLAVTGCASPGRPVVPVQRASDLTAPARAATPAPPAPTPGPAGATAESPAPPPSTPPPGPVPTSAAPPAPAPAPAEASLALEPVTENRAFVTVDGVPRYKVGVGDVLEILLATGLTQERQTAVVKANGAVSAAFLEVKVAGLTPDQASEAIRGQLTQFYRQIGVEVLVREYNSKRITVLGAVAGKVGSLPLKGRMTLLDLLAEVGGPAGNADLERVRIVRPDGPSLTLNLLRLLDEPVLQSFALDAGDVVFVPALGAPSALPAAAPAATGLAAGTAGQIEARVFVFGEVRAPGAVSFTPNMRLSQALALAGGPTDVAVLESARVIRGGLQSPQIVESDFRRLLEQGDLRQDLPLQPNDLVLLPRSGIGNWNAFLAKIRPSLELLTFPLALPVQIRAISR
jgi:polysaccharide export outer membrane protein